MDLGRDLLDQLLLDQDWQRIGRVDGVIIELRDGAPPRVAAMELGAVTLARRIHPAVERWLRALARRLKIDVTPVRIPLTAFRDVGLDIQLELDAATRRAVRAVDRWLVRHVLFGRGAGS